jgi:hypothetical protein
MQHYLRDALQQSTKPAAAISGLKKVNCVDGTIGEAVDEEKRRERALGSRVSQLESNRGEH